MRRNEPTASPPRGAGTLARAMGLLLAAACLHCSSEPPPPTPAAPQPAQTSDAPVRLLPVGAEPIEADEALAEGRLTDALPLYFELPPSPERCLGLGQAHLALGRLYRTLAPAARLWSRALEATGFQSPQGPGAEPLERLAALDDAALAKEWPLLARALPSPIRPEALDTLAGLHLRLARLALMDFSRLSSNAARRGKALALADAATRPEADPPLSVLNKLLLQEGPPSPPLQPDIANAAAEDLLALDAGWLVVRAVALSRSGSCSGYALGAVDLATLERAYPGVSGACASYRRLYAANCSLGGQLAGG